MEGRARSKRGGWEEGPWQKSRPSEQWGCETRAWAPSQCGGFQNKHMEVLGRGHQKLPQMQAGDSKHFGIFSDESFL